MRFWHGDFAFTQNGLKSDYIRQWGGEYAIASSWVTSRLSVMTNGEILFFSTEEQMKSRYGEDAEMKYLVVGWDGSGWLNASIPLTNVKYGSYEEYKAPIRAVHLRPKF